MHRSLLHFGFTCGLLAVVGMPLDSSAGAGARGGPRKPVDPSSDALEAHNKERKRAGVPPLQWDAKLARFAGEWAKKLCRGGKGFPSLNHRPQKSGSPGENLWAGATSEAEGYPIGEAVKRWAEEARHFDSRSGTCKGGVCGHYTQVVWRSTTHVGCGVAVCPAAGMTATVWVCNYRPAGNVIGERPF